MEKLIEKVSRRTDGGVQAALDEAKRLYNNEGEKKFSLLCGKENKVLVVVVQERISKGDLITLLREHSDVKDRIIYVAGDEKATNYSLKEKAIVRIDFFLEKEKVVAA